MIICIASRNTPGYFKNENLTKHNKDQNSAMPLKKYN